MSYAAYLWKTVWPGSLAFYYPHPSTVHGGIPTWKIVGSIFLLSGVSLVAWRKRRDHPWLAVGWSWYLGTLVPVIGLVQVGGQAMADRYTYVPLIGVFIAAAWSVSAAFDGRRGRWVLPVVSGAVILAFSAAARVQAGYWRDGFTLFSRATAVTEENWLALNGLGEVYDHLGQHEQAIRHFREVLRINPTWAEGWKNLGVAYDGLGNSGQAIFSYREAVRLKPAYSDAWYNLGVSSGKLGRIEQAISSYREALRIRPDHAEALNNLGMIYDNLGRREQAIASYRESLRIKPDQVEAWNNLGVTYANLDRIPEAIACFRESLRINPDDRRAKSNLAAVSDKPERSGN